MVFCPLSLLGEGVLRPSCLPLRLHHRVCHVYKALSSNDGLKRHPVHDGNVALKPCRRAILLLSTEKLVSGPAHTRKAKWEGEDRKVLSNTDGYPAGVAVCASIALRRT